MMNFEKVQRICQVENPLDWNTEKDRMMVEACREMADFHYQNNQVIKHLYDKKGFSAEELQSVSDLSLIPSLGVTAMKHYLMTSISNDEAVLKLTSSGTKGIKTQVWFDQGSLDRVQKMLDTLWSQEGFYRPDEEVNYLIYTYNPDQADNLGIAFSCKNQMRFTKVKNVNYAINKNKNGDWEYSKDHLKEVFKRYEADGIPVRMSGMPSFIYEFIESLGDMSFNFHPESLIMTGGGWKASEDKQITRDSFRQLCLEKFGIPLNRQRDGFGMAEHSSPYFECAEHRFHIPAYNRIFIRDPKTMSLVPDGEIGLMELLTPFNAMMPTLSLLTTDWALINVESCPCGHNSPTFELRGRAGVSKHKGCALQADELVKRRAK